MVRGISEVSKQASEVQALLGHKRHFSTKTHTDMKYHRGVLPFHQAVTVEYLVATRPTECKYYSEIMCPPVLIQLTAI